MDILITYDVNTETKAGRKRLRKVAQACKNFGQRVQKSVFECHVNEMQFELLKKTTVEIIDKKSDSLRFTAYTEIGKIALRFMDWINILILRNR